MLSCYPNFVKLMLTFFCLFERLVDVMKWPENEQTLLQCVLTGKVQKAYSSLSVHDSQKYLKVKDAVLKAYELVPEAYRQKFRNLRKPAEQTYCEFARDLKIQLDRWCTASGANSREDFHKLFLLEQFKSTLPEHVSTFLADRNVTSTENAAILTDEYVLTHKCEVKKGRFKFSDVPTEGVTVPRQVLSEHYNRGERSWKSDADKSDRCAYCHLKGHWKKDCLALKGKLMRVKSEHKPVLVVSSVQTDESDVPIDTLQKSEKSVAFCNDGDVGYAPFITEGYVSLLGSTDKVPIRILRDTGASESFILESVLPFSQETDMGNRVLIRGIGLQTLSVPLHNVFLQSDLVNRSVVMGVRPSLPVEGVSVILGNNLAGDHVWSDVTSPPVVTTCPTSLGDMDISQQHPEVFVSCALTRAMSKEITDDRLRDFKGLVKSQRMVPGLLALPSVSYQVWVCAQREDSSLKSLFDAVLSPEVEESSANGYFIENEVLLRKWTFHAEGGLTEPTIQVVVPVSLRNTVLESAHGGVSGHFGVNKTYQHLLQYFYWTVDVRQFIKTCSTCQLTGKPNQTMKPVPLYPIPAMGQPFQHLLVDCVGPLPPSKSGCVYLLTVMCQSTRYPAAYPLRSITTRSVVKALSQFISIFGIPKVIQSDQGTNFTSNMFQEVLKQLCIRHNRSTAYHPESQGALERFHQTLKSLLRAYCTELKGDWEEGLPWLLLAAREVVQESLGFSPNQLVFGHCVRGPLGVLCDGALQEEPPQSLIQYIHGFRRRLVLAGELAREKLGKTQEKMKCWFDRKSEVRLFSPGDQVLALFALPDSPFCAKFSGPYTVLRKVSDHNYILSTPECRKHSQLCHVNLLKPFYACTMAPKVISSSVALASLTPRSDLDQDVKPPDDVMLQPRLKKL